MNVEEEKEKGHGHRKTTRRHQLFRQRSDSVTVSIRLRSSAIVTRTDLGQASTSLGSRTDESDDNAQKWRQVSNVCDLWSITIEKSLINKENYQIWTGKINL